MPASSHHLFPGANVLGHTLLGLYAHHGPAELWLARARAGRAVKMLARVGGDGASNAQAGEAFSQQQIRSGQIRHPNLLQTLEVDVQSGRKVLVCEFLDGHNLLQVGYACRLLDTTVPFSILGYVLGAVLEGLDRVHRLKEPSSGAPMPLFHGGVCPDCILVGFAGEVKLELFVNHAATSTGEGAGWAAEGNLLHYLAPETLRDGHVDARSDVFGVGVTLYEMLTHTLPFAGPDAATLQRVMEEQTPVTPLVVNPLVPEPVSAICLKALERNPARRYESAREMKDALEEYARAAAKDVSMEYLAAFMNLLFPPDQDPQRLRTATLLAAGGPSLAPPRQRQAEDTTPGPSRLETAGGFEQATLRDLPRAGALIGEGERPRQAPRADEKTEDNDDVPPPVAPTAQDSAGRGGARAIGSHEPRFDDLTIRNLPADGPTARGREVGVEGHAAESAEM